MSGIPGKFAKCEGCAQQNKNEKDIKTTAACCKEFRGVNKPPKNESQVWCNSKKRQNPPPTKTDVHYPSNGRVRAVEA
jgi:hypothetical protein